MSVLRPSRRPTMNDVAEAAGVSSATVSRVLNGKAWVAKETRESVLNAIATTGYTANHQARSLATGRSESVAFLLSAQVQDLFADPTFSQLLTGVVSALADQDMTVVLLVAGTERERRQAAKFVKSGHVDGVIFVSPHEADPTLKQLAESNMPLVSIGLPLGFQDLISSVSVDEVGSAMRAVEQLRARGCSRIAHIAGPLDTPGGKFREQGFLAIVGGEGCSLSVEGDWSVRSGREAMAQLLNLCPTIDGVFAASDSMAVGAMLEIQDRGLAVPDSVAVIGFDDSGLAEAAKPPLTTMRQPWTELSRLLVELLLEQIDGAPMRRVTLPAELVIRESA